MLPLSVIFKKWKAVLFGPERIKNYLDGSDLLLHSAYMNLWTKMAVQYRGNTFSWE